MTLGRNFGLEFNSLINKNKKTKLNVSYVFIPYPIFKIYIQLLNQLYL